MERKAIKSLTAIGAAIAIGLVAYWFAKKLQAIESRLSAVKISQTSLRSGVNNLTREVTRFSHVFPAISHKDVRMFMIQQQARQAPKGSILLIGDSIAEGLFPERVCRLAVLNAGIGGAGVSTFRDQLTEIAKESQPSIVVIALGVNDARAAAGNESPAVREWSWDYLDLVKKAKRTGAIPVLMTVLPVERERPLGSKYFNPKQIQMMNKEIRRIAAEKQVQLAESYREFSDEEGYGKKGSTVDGVHLTAESYRSWKKINTKNVAQALGRKESYCEAQLKA